MRGHHGVSRLVYCPARKGYGWSGRTVMTAMSGVLRSCATTSAYHQAGARSSSAAAASIITWEIVVYARTQAASVSASQIAEAKRLSEPMRHSPTAG